jgi:hypothetical protein
MLLTNLNLADLGTALVLFLAHVGLTRCLRSTLHGDNAALEELFGFSAVDRLLLRQPALLRPRFLLPWAAPCSLDRYYLSAHALFWGARLSGVAFVALIVGLFGNMVCFALAR